MIKLTILTGTERIKTRDYEILSKRSGLATATDFAILLGALVDEVDFDKPISDDDKLWKRYLHDIKSIENRTVPYWTRKSPSCERSYNMKETDRFCGIRPVTQYSEIKKNCKNERITEDGITVVEWGVYPQQAASKEMQETLENLFNEGNLKETGKIYTTDSRIYHEYNKDFKAREHIEYEYSGKKYIRVKADTVFCGLGSTLSNGKKYKDIDYVWVEVQPIVWAIDKEKNIAITEKLIVSGIQYNNYNEEIEEFDKTNLYNFMNNYLVNDIIPKEYTQVPIITDYDINDRGIINLTIANIPLEKIKLINITSVDKKEEALYSRK